jgi:hypothetical protein
LPKINKRLYGPAQLGNTTATRYTTPASTRAVIRQIYIHNPEGGSSRTYTFGIGADAAGTRLRDAKTIAVGDTHIIYGPFTLEAAEIFVAHASAASALVMVVDGEEQSVG